MWYRRAQQTMRQQQAVGLPNVNGPQDSQPAAVNQNDPYAVGTTRAEQEMDKINHSQQTPAWYNVPLGAQIEKLHMERTVNPASPDAAQNYSNAESMASTEPARGNMLLTERGSKNYDEGKGYTPFQGNDLSAVKTLQ